MGVLKTLSETLSSALCVIKASEESSEEEEMTLVFPSDMVESSARTRIFTSRKTQNYNHIAKIEDKPLRTSLLKKSCLKNPPKIEVRRTLLRKCQICHFVAQTPCALARLMLHV